MPFLKSTLTGVKAKPFVEPGTFLRRWTYRIEFTERSPSGSFKGVLTAKGPWNPDDALSLNVVGQLQSGLRAFPSVIALDRSGREPASLIVVCKSPRGRLELGIEPSPRIPLTIKEEPGDGERKTHRLVFALERPVAPGEIETRITIRERGTAEKLVIPVKIVSKE